MLFRHELFMSLQWIKDGGHGNHGQVAQFFVRNTIPGIEHQHGATVIAYARNIGQKRVTDGRCNQNNCGPWRQRISPRVHNLRKGSNNSGRGHGQGF